MLSPPFFSLSKVVVADASSFLEAASSDKKGSRVTAALAAETAIIEGFDLNVKVFFLFSM